MKYLEECKYIWKNLVPESGQANSLQGELLRQIEKLRYEAQNNGNINWDADFAYFCDFLTATLGGSEALSPAEKSDVSDALIKIKKAGQTAYRYNNGEISDEELMEEYNCELAYIDNDAYDLVCDAIVAFYRQNQQPIPYAANPDIYR